MHRIALDNAGDKPFFGTIEVAYRPWLPAEGGIVAARRFRSRASAFDAEFTL